MNDAPRYGNLILCVCTCQYCRGVCLHLDSCSAPATLLPTTYVHIYSNTPLRAYLSETAWKIKLARPSHLFQTITTLCASVNT